jgi:dimethylargininase
MTTKDAIAFGSRLVASPTAKLRAAVLVRPTAGIESARPLHGEPGAVYARALEQHEILRKTLAFFGVDTIVLDARGEDAYESAVLDAAAVFADGAFVMRPTEMSRRAEADRLEAEFARIGMPIAGRIGAPGLLDGSDVLLAGTTAFIGAGARGNAFGREQFAAAAKERGFDPVEVPLPAAAPPLRALACAVASDTVVVAAEGPDPAVFRGFKTILLERGEASAAGVLVLGERHVIADVRYKTSLARMRKSGLTVEGIDLYDFEKVGITPSMLALGVKRG